MKLDLLIKKEKKPHIFHSKSYNNMAILLVLEEMKKKISFLIGS